MVTQAVTMSVCAGVLAQRDMTALGDRYVDGAFAFSIRPPQGCRIDREKKAVFSGGIQLVEFARSDGPWRLAVTRSSTERPVTIDEMMQGLPLDLIRNRPDGQIIARRKRTIAAHDGALVAVSYPSDGVDWYVQEAIVRLKPAQFFRITFRTPLQNREEATDVFGAIVDSFDLIHSEPTQASIKQASQRGIGLLARLSGRTLADKLVSENYFRFVVDGADAGYLRVRESATEHKGIAGVRIRERTWMFEKDGSYKHVSSDFFVSDDLANETWESRMHVLFPADKTTPLRLLTVFERARRVRDTLIVAFNKGPDEPELANRVLSVPKAYIPMVVQRLLPRLVDLNQEQLYAFGAYGSDRRGIVTRTFRVLGSGITTIDGRVTRGYRLQDCEGIAPPATDMFVDKDGHVLQVVSGDVVMLPATKQQIDRLYGEKRARGGALLREALSGAPPPGPAPRNVPSNRR